MKDFEDFIDEDEKIIEVLCPDKWAMLLWTAIFCGLIALVGLIILFELGAVGLSFIIVSLICWFICNAIYKKYAYCITDKRIIVKPGMFFVKSWRFIELASITTVDVVVGISDRIINGDKGSGTLIFHNESNATKWISNHKRNAFLHIITPIKYKKLINDLVEKAKRE